MLLKNYLESANVQHTLSRKPGDEGFSLIELVVVVAVLAILAAIAIPQFSQLSDDARLNSAKSIMANMYKECEFNEARTATGFHTEQVDGTPGGVTWNALAQGTGCGDWAVAKIGDGNSCNIYMNLSSGKMGYVKAAAFPTATFTEKAWPNNLEDCT